MNIHNLLLHLLLLLVCAEKKEIENPFSRDWGNHYTFKWQDCSVGRQDILKISKAVNKPVMWILFWKNGCQACYHLRESFGIDNEIQRLSKNFLMVNCEGNEIPDDPDFFLDGEYSPKIIFTDTTGTVRSEIYNRKGKPEHKYYYVDADMLRPSMRDAARLLRGKEAEL